MFCETDTDAEALQPFAGLVTVTELVPGALTVLEEPVPPPLQLYVTPAGETVGVKVTFVATQVSVAGEILTVGGVIFWLTETEPEAVHPLAGSVTVTEYVPDEETVFVDDVPPPLQL